ncbi:MAG: biopolymer transporter ExbD [Candidatus Sulfotelmatobacter sp.]
MTWLKTNNLGKLNNRLWSAALLAVVIAMSAAPQSSAQAMQRGISVELVPTSSAVPVPDADKSDALIVTVTDDGTIYLGAGSVTPDSLAEKLKGRLSHTQTLYIKADARAPYASLVNVVDAAHTAGIARVTLLTTRPKTAQVGTVVSPEGIEMELPRRSAPATK